MSNYGLTQQPSVLELEARMLEIELEKALLMVELLTKKLAITRVQIGMENKL
jgi:hypothetical protein